MINLTRMTLVMGGVAATAAVFASVESASAAHIDFFSEGTGSELLLRPSDPDNQDNQTYIDSDLDTIPLFGGTRFEQIFNAPGGEEGVDVASQVDINDGQYVYSNAASSRGTLRLTYGAAGSVSDIVTAGDEPTDYRSLRITVGSVDLTAPADFTVSVTDTEGDTDSQTIAVNSAGDYFVPYNMFSDSVDLTSLSALQLDAVGRTTGLDVTLNEIFRSTVVPEPASLALLGMGGMLMIRRRRA